MRCKHCGKELKYDINNDTYVIYNGDIYCDTDCMLFDVYYGSKCHHYILHIYHY